MEVLNQELQLQSGEADVVRGLLALNAAQDYFEGLLAQEGANKLSSTGTVATTANTETSSFPTGFLRIDSIWMLDSSSNQEYELEDLQHTGGHSSGRRWPFNLLTSTSTGKPEAYYTNGRYIFWSPKPDAIYSTRIYGLLAADSITASGTFSYDDLCALPFASFAVRLLRMGVGDEAGDVGSIAKETLGSALSAMSGYNRTGASGLEYSQVHNA
jgi:hypothetical protein